MILRWLQRIYARINLWLDKSEKDMNQWRKEDPDAYYTFIEQQQRNFRGGDLNG